MSDINDLYPYSGQHLEYLCPLCWAKSLINEFGGDIVEAECRKCGGRFKPAAGNLEILRALYYRDNQ